MNYEHFRSLSLTFGSLLRGSVWAANGDEGLSTSVERSILCRWACILDASICRNIVLSFSRLCTSRFVLIVDKSWSLAFEDDVVPKGILV